MSLIYNLLQEMDGLASLLSQDNERTIDLSLVYMVSIRGSSEDLKAFMDLKRTKTFNFMGSENTIDILDLKEAGLYQVPDYVLNFEKESAAKLQRWASERTDTNLIDYMCYIETHHGNDEKGWRRKIWGGANDPVVLTIDKVEDGTGDMYIGLIVREFPIHWFTSFMSKLKSTKQIELTWIGENKWRADYGMIQQFPDGTTKITMNDIDQYSSIIVRTLPLLDRSDEMLDHEEELVAYDLDELKSWIQSSIDNVGTRGYLGTVGKGNPTVFTLIKELLKMPYATIGDLLAILTQLRLIEDTLTHEKEYEQFKSQGGYLIVKIENQAIALRDELSKRRAELQRAEFDRLSEQHNLTTDEVRLVKELIQSGQGIGPSVANVLDARNKAKSVMDKIIKDEKLEDIAKQAGQQVLNSSGDRKKFDALKVKLDKDIELYERKSDAYIEQAMLEAGHATPLTDEEMLAHLEYLYASKDIAASLYTRLKNFTRENEVWKSLYYPLLDDLLDSKNDGKYDKVEIGRIYLWIEQQPQGE